MSLRNIHLVGSMPFADEQDAMQRALQYVGPHLTSLPDGEIGEKTERYPNGKRAAWVMTAVDRCTADTDHWEVAEAGERDENGFPVDYNKVQQLRPRHSPKAMYKHLDFGYHTYFKENYPIFRKLREAHQHKDIRFQVGVPTGLGITFSMMSKLNALRYADVFNQRIAYEVDEILKVAGDDVVVQIEVPGELALAYQLPKLLVGLPLKSIYGLLGKISRPALCGIHLCLGDLNHKALIHPKTLGKMVHFSNELVKRWPANHQLEYVHYPLAEAADPPPLERSYYTALKDIKLPPGVRFVAGFVHNKRSDAEHLDVLRIIEGVRNEPVGIACSCGMGRHSVEEAVDLLRAMHKVAKTA